MKPDFKWSRAYADELLSHVRHREIIRRMDQHAMAQADLEGHLMMTDSQLRAATYLLDKVVPDAPKRVEHDLGGSLAELIEASFKEDDTI